jgi:hypothetical protein
MKNRTILFALILVSLSVPRNGWGATAASLAPPVQPTNYVVVTNVAFVTNYVLITSPSIITNRPGGETNSSLPPLSWVPREDNFDWIQLESGEWLKGRIQAMQERELDFDGEELELMTVEWKKIRQVRSSKINRVLYGDNHEISGPIWVTPDQVTVGGRGASHLFPKRTSKHHTRRIEGPKLLVGKVSTGMTFQAGNTKSADFNAQAALQRRTPETRLKFDYLGNVSSVEDVESANNHRLNSASDYWLSRKLYLILPQADQGGEFTPQALHSAALK